MDSKPNNPQRGQNCLLTVFVNGVSLARLNGGFVRTKGRIVRMAQNIEGLVKFVLRLIITKFSFIIKTN